MSDQNYPPGFEEDDRLRSRFVREMTLSQMARASRQTPVSHAERGTPIPKTLVQFWHDAHDVPTDVRRCMESWEPLRRAGFVVRTFDDDTAAEYIAARYGPREREAFSRCNHPAMRSDYFRLCYMLAEGGLYVDADDVLLSDGWEPLFLDATLKLHPLAFDVASMSMLADADLGRAELPHADTIFYVNNNPIAAPRGHRVIGLALARATAGLLRRAPVWDIQSTTGPGNLTAALCAHARHLQVEGLPPDYLLMLDWERTAEPRWDLCYRSDSRNWRNWRP